MGEEAQSKIRSLRDAGLEVFAFAPTKELKNWKRIARKKIRECDYVCWFFNGDSYVNHSENTLWEYKKAVHYHKRIILIDLGQNEEIEKLIKGENKFIFKGLFNEDYKDQDSKLSISSFDEAKDKLVGLKDWKTDDIVFATDPENEKTTDPSYAKMLLEQYRIMINTSESLMNRRQTASNVYVAILSALISLVGSSFAFANKMTTGILFFVVGVITVILSNNWKRMLNNFSKNNEGKFAVINAIEKRLPANMFESEYRYNKMKSISSYSDRENALCQIFSIIGCVLLCSGITIFFLAYYHLF